MAKNKKTEELNWSYAPSLESTDHIQLQKKYELFIDGKFVKPKSGNYFDTINPAFTDKLSDIEPNLKPWYQRYYIPTVQEKKNTWQPYIGNLRKNSSHRISSNKDYSSFIKEEGEWSLAAANEDNKKDDPQMLEAINILKEMVDINSKNNLQNVVSH